MERAGRGSGAACRRLRHDDRSGRRRQGEGPPAQLVVLGGGYIGSEMAQAYRRFGSRVTIVERGARLMAREDVDISEGMRGILTNEGIDIVTGAEAVRVEGRSGTQVRVVLRSASG